MTTSKTNLFVSFSASSKSVNSILKGFGEKLKNYIARGAIREKQGDTLSLSEEEETDPQKLKLEYKKALVYNTFCDQIYNFLSLGKRRGFSVKYLDSFKERILRDKESLFSHSENLEMLFLIDLIKEIRKLRHKIEKNKRDINNGFMQADIDQMDYKMYNTIPESVFYRLENDRMEGELNERLQKAKVLYPDNLEARENYLMLYGFV